MWAIIITSLRTCHEIWHGLVFSVIAICLLARSLERRSLFVDFAVGLCVGAVFLTKPDLFVGIVLTCAVAAVSLVRSQGAGAWRSLFMWGAATLVVPAAFLTYFRAHCSWSDSLKSVAGAWTPLFTSNLSSEPFYRWCFGLDAPGHHLSKMGIQAGVVIGVLALFAGMFRLGLRTPLSRIAAVSIVAVIAALASDIEWVDAGRVLPLLTIVVLVRLLWTVFSIKGVIALARTMVRPGLERSPAVTFSRCSGAFSPSPSLPNSGSTRAFGTTDLSWRCLPLSPLFTSVCGCCPGSLNAMELASLRSARPYSLFCSSGL